MNPCPTHEQRWRALLALHGSLLEKHKVRFHLTRQLWWEEQQRGIIRGFIWSSGLVCVQAYRAVSEDFVMSYRLTQDHDFASYYRAVFRIIPVSEIPYAVVDELLSKEKTCFTDIVWGVFDMSRVNYSKPTEDDKTPSDEAIEVEQPQLFSELAHVGGGD